jgi:glycosyltransferase involved in cell wall biosynthesis
MTEDVTVIIRAHESAPFLIDALDSIEVQEGCNSITIQLILDRPSKKLLTSLESYNGACKLSITESKARNLSASMNLGLDQATTEYIAVLDSDDVMSKDRLVTQIEFLKLNPGVGVVGSDFSQINALGKVLNLCQMPTRVLKGTGSRWLASPLAHSTVMYRKSEIIKLGSYREFFEYAEDLDLWLRVSSEFEIANLSQPLTSYRIHDGQTTSRYFLNIAFVQVAAICSDEMRSRNRPDLPEIFQDLRSWRRSKRFSIMTWYKVLFEVTLHKLDFAHKRGNPSEIFLWKIVLVGIYPKFSLSSAFSRQSN